MWLCVTDATVMDTSARVRVEIIVIIIKVDVQACRNSFVAYI